MNTGYRTARAAIAAEAAAWVVQIDDEALNLDARRELLAWLRSSPQHIDEFLMATATWQELDAFDVERKLDLEQLIAETKQNVVALGVDRETDATCNNKLTETSTPGSWRQWAAAAVVLVAIGTGLAVRALNQQPEFETDVGHQMTFTLEDGSVVQLNTQSALDTRFTENEREVTLLKGEAMFEVAKDPVRPFRVRSGPVTVQAIGTRFNVYRREDATTVTVEEGTASVLNEIDKTALDPQATEPGVKNEQHVAMLVLKAGEEVRTLSRGGFVQSEAADLEKSTAWRQRRLVFLSDSLQTVAEEFNRYNQLKIDIQVPPQDARQITGTFNADDPGSFIAFLEKNASFEVIR